MAQPVSVRTSWGCVALPSFVGAALAALGALGWIEGAWVRVATFPVVALGYALPFLAWRSPRESSLVKLLVLSACASPPLGALVFLVLRTWLATDVALGVTFALPAAGALSLLRLRASFERPSRVVVLALALGVGAVAAFVGSSTLDAGFVGFDRIALTQAFARAVPPEDPLLAGTPWTRAGSFEGLLAYVASAWDVAPHVACAVLLGCALLVLPTLLALLAAPLLGDGKAELAALVGALLGVGSFGPEPLLPGLLVAWTGDPARVLALVWLVAGALASAHALRHGRSPWVECVALFHAFAFALDPRTTAVSSAALALAALVCPGRPPGGPDVRARVLLAVALSIVPLWLAARSLGLDEPRFGEPVTPLAGSGPPAALAAALVVGAWVLLARTGAWRRAVLERPASAVEDRSLRTWLALAITAGVGGAWLVDGVEPAFGGAITGFVLTAALVRLSRGSLRARLGAAGLGGLLVASGLPALRPAAASERVDGLATHDWAYVLAPTDDSSATERDVLAALRWLALELPFRDRAPILIAHPARPLALDDPDRFGERRAVVAAVLANLDLWCTTAELATGAPTESAAVRARRLAGAKAIFETKDGFDRELIGALDDLGRPGIVLVTRRDRWRFPWLENKFGPYGFRVLKVCDSVGLFVWPPEWAEQVPAAERAFPEHHFPSGPAVFGREEER